MLGYGATDHPVDPKDYRYKRQVESLLDILDQEKIEKVVVVSHDWGTLPASRLLNYAPEPVLAAVFIASTYAPPKGFMDLAKVNAWSKEHAGYERRGYFEFMTEERAADTIREHIDSWMSLFWAKDPSIWETDFCPSGAMGAWVRADRRTPVATWLTEEEYAIYKNYILTGIDAQLNWYHVSRRNLSYEEEQELPENAEYVHMPVLLLPCTKDKAAIAQIARENGKKYCSDVEIVDLESSHWAPCAVPDEVNSNIERFLKVKLL